MLGLSLTPNHLESVSLDTDPTFDTLADEYSVVIQTSFFGWISNPLTFFSLGGILLKRLVRLRGFWEFIGSPPILTFPSGLITAGW